MLHFEVAVYSVKDVGKRKSDGGASGIEFNTVLRSRKRKTENQKDDKSSSHKVHSHAARRRRPSGNMDCRIKSAVVASPTCIASCAANIRGSEESASSTFLRSQAERSIDNIKAAIKAGRRMRLRWTAAYASKLSSARASARAKPCSKPSRRPSPVIASTEPEASPTSDICSR